MVNKLFYSLSYLCPFDATWYVSRLEVLLSGRMFIYLFGVLRRFQHCTGHIMTVSWKDRGNQYIQLVSRFCTVNCRPTASNYQLSDLRPGREPNPSLRGGRQECYHSATLVHSAITIAFQVVPFRPSCSHHGWCNSLL